MLEMFWTKDNSRTVIISFSWCCSALYQEDDVWRVSDEKRSRKEDEDPKKDPSEDRKECQEDYEENEEDEEDEEDEDLDEDDEDEEDDDHDQRRRMTEGRLIPCGEETNVHPLILHYLNHSKVNWKIKFNDPLVEEVFKAKKEYCHEGFIDGSQIQLKLVEKIGRKSNLKACGSALEPHLESLLSVATPSRFGKGDKTVFDETVRKGRELDSSKMKVEIGSGPKAQLKKQIKQALFPQGREMDLKFSKMAIYESGGHFDFHRDTVRSKSHAGTLLIEVRSGHTGGQFVLSRHGIERAWNLQDNLPSDSAPVSATVAPAVSSLGTDDPKVRFIAFYTDVLHRVEPVENGVRAVLQFDIHISIPTPKPKPNSELKEFFDTTKPFGDPVNDEFTSRLMRSLDPLVTDTHGVALPLFHLYADHQLVPQSLKLSDAQLFLAFLSHGFCVQLVPILLNARSETSGYFEEDEEDMYGISPGYGIRAYPTANVGYIFGGSQEAGHSSSTAANPATATMSSVVSCPIYQSPSEVTYIATGFEQVLPVDEELGEPLGNEASTIELRYFGVAFLITRKSVLEPASDPKGKSKKQKTSTA
jgi:hypothetical protein